VARGVPFDTYETHHTRFVTEYGFQSFPEMKTIEAFTEPRIGPASSHR